MIHAYRKHLIWLLLSVLCLQTLAAFADVHHSADAEACFVEQMHEHDDEHAMSSDMQEASENDDSTHHDEHCCHGHCAHHLLLTLSLNNMVARPCYQTHLLTLRNSLRPSSLLRPPQT